MAGFKNRVVSVSQIPKSGLDLPIVADDVLASELAEAINAVSVDELKVDLHLGQWRQGGVSMQGRVQGSITQQCVNTLEPMESPIKFEFTRYFVQPVPDSADGVVALGRYHGESFEDGELVIDPDADDIPDEIENDRLDVWSVVLEEINLNIDLFPKKSSIEWQENEIQSNKSPENEVERPFADLKNLLAEKGKKHS